MSFNGRWIPSKMLPIIPGPNSTESGLPVLRTGSPTVTPAIIKVKDFWNPYNKIQERKVSLILLSTLFYKLTLKIFGFKYFSFATKYNQVRAIRIKFEQSTFFLLKLPPPPPLPIPAQRCISCRNKSSYLQSKSVWWLSMTKKTKSWKSVITKTEL